VIIADSYTSTQPLHRTSYSGALEELAGLPPLREPRLRYSCYIAPPFRPRNFGAHVLALHTAILRHLHMFSGQMPQAAYVSPVSLEQLFVETERICRCNDEELSVLRSRIYQYKFCLGPIRKTIFTHRDRDLPEALREIREIGLPDCATVCVHYD
jgi:hypothetical protein